MAKDKGKRDANTKTTQRCVIEEETEVLGVNLSVAFQAVNNLLENKVGIHEQQKTLQA